MITYAQQRHGGNPNAVYVTGQSSGAMMTNVMLADYPDVFKAGASFMGVPYRCFYTGTVRGWNSACAQGQVNRTAQQWGGSVRTSGYPGYTGPRPRVQLWHGTNDTILSHNNLGEAVEQWTDVLGVSQTPSTTDSPVTNWTRTRYRTSAGTTQVEAYSLAASGHELPVKGSTMAAEAIRFMGLDATAPRRHHRRVARGGRGQVPDRRQHGVGHAAADQHLQRRCQTRPGRAPRPTS
ncbi:hypothetical protein GCM10020229_71350 [Kitasatospora albolonga]